MDLEDLLDLDEQEPIEHRVGTALRALPYPAYLARLSACFGELAAYYAPAMTVEGHALVRRIGDLVEEAATGSDVRDRAAALSTDVEIYCGLDPEDELDTGDSVDFDGAFLGACTALLWEYSGDGARYSASDEVAGAAAQAVDPEAPAENLRMLLRFLQYAES